jgi:transposase
MLDLGKDSAEVDRRILLLIEAAPNPDCPGCQALLKRVERLERELRELRALLDRNSSNSSKPPSSDSPSQRTDRPSRPSSGKRPGGQPGHDVHHRELLPAEQVTRRERRDPRHCRRCSASLALAEELEPLHHQVVEIPRITPDVTEYVLGRRRCRICNTLTTARLPRGVPHGMCGPRLSALIVLLTGVYHVSRRNAAALLDDVLGVKLALGSVSNVEKKMAAALSDAHTEALACVRQARVKHLDATSWSQSGEPRSLWTFASRLATAFVITANATAETVRGLVGHVRGTLVTDRGSQFGFWAMERRQICWAHLVRKFAAFTQSPRPEVQRLGEALLLLSHAHLVEWHRVRDGIETRERMQAFILRLEPIFVGHLERGAALRLREVSGACANLLAHRDALFTYAFVEGVPPTNNHAERELRGFVMWRKQTAGTRSERGDRFAERVMTAVHTLRKQGRHVLSYLEQACVATLRGAPTPALILQDP